jgi:phosphocarrier protein
MLTKEIIIKNRSGLHTRPAAAVVKTASRYKSDVKLIRDGFAINAKSIIGVMTLAAEQGSALTIQVDGSDEQDAMNELFNLFDTGFGEI